MDGVGREQRREHDEDEDEEPVIRAAALAYRHDRKPGDDRLHRHAAADEALRQRRQRVDHETRQDASEKGSASPAFATTGDRGRPRKVTPKALTKHAAASAADNASTAPTEGTRIFRPHCGSAGLKRMAWKVSHSETKPLSGGSAEMAAQPTRKAKLAHGMR